MALANNFATPSAIPISAFRRSVVTPVKGRYEVTFDPSSDATGPYWDSDGRRRAQVLDVVKVGERKLSKGIEYIQNELLDYIRRVVLIGRTNNGKVSDDWNEFYDQYKGVPPPKSDGMICEIAYNISLPVIRNVVSTIKQPLVTKGWFRYEPPDESQYGKAIASMMQEISKAQINLPAARFWRELNRYLHAFSVFGFGIAVAEHRKVLNKRLPDYQDEVVDRGTGFETIMPYFTLIQETETPYFQDQPSLFYVHKTTVPLMQTNHYAAIVGNEDGLVFPTGQYLNLDKVENLTRDNSGTTTMVRAENTEMQAHIDIPAQQAIRGLTAFSGWSRELNLPRLVKEAKKADPNLTDEEIYVEMGWHPEQWKNSYDHVWKLCAVGVNQRIGVEGIQPEVLVQAMPSPYYHGQFPVVGTQCIEAFNETYGQGFGAVIRDTQLITSLLITLAADNAIRDSVTQYVTAKQFLANPPDEPWNFTQASVFEVAQGVQPKDAQYAIQKLKNEPRPAMQEGLVILDRLIGMSRSASSTNTPPFQGDRTATEVTQIVTESTTGLQAQAGENIIDMLGEWAEIQRSNNAQFLSEDDAIHLAGQAGLNIEAVRKFQDFNGGLMQQPVRIMTFGKNRIGDRILRARALAEVQRTPAWGAIIQAKMMGMELDDFLRRVGRESLDGIVEDPSYFFPDAEPKLTIEQIKKMLSLGQPVDVDITRFNMGPDGLMQAQQELVAIAPLARAGIPAAVRYHSDLQLAIQTLMTNMRQIAMQTGMMQQGGGGGQSGAAQVAQMPMPSFLPRNGYTEGTAIQQGMVPTAPNQSQWNR